MAPHNIVILGGSFAGISIAHYLLRHTIPSLARDKSAYKVTIVNPSTHVLYKISAPRVAINPSLIPAEKVIIPIASGFKEYDPSQIEIIQAEATSIDANSETVGLAYTDGSARSSTITYGSLVIATGTITASPLWTLHGTHEATKAALEEVHNKLPKAKTVLIAGGGPVGVETAGEVAVEHNDKDVTILSGSSRLLPRLDTKSMGRDAESKLKSMRVKVVHNLKVESATQTDNGKTTLRFSDGTEKTVDLYIDATGDRPNSGFIPKEWLNSRGYVEVDEPSLRVKGVSDVYAAGSIIVPSNGGFMDLNNSIKPVCESIKFDRLGQTGGISEQGPEPLGWIAWLTSWFVTPVEPGKRTQNYKRMTKDMQIVPLGRTGGVGVIMGFRVPTFLVKMVKSKTFFVEKAPELVKGHDYVKP